MTDLKVVVPDVCPEHNKPREWDQCPFEVELNENYEECYCCSECRYQCGQDI